MGQQLFCRKKLPLSDGALQNIAYRPITRNIFCQSKWQLGFLLGTLVRKMYVARTLESIHRKCLSWIINTFLIKKISMDFDDLGFSIMFLINKFIFILIILNTHLTAHQASVTAICKQHVNTILLLWSRKSLLNKHFFLNLTDTLAIIVFFLQCFLHSLIWGSRRHRQTPITFIFMYNLRDWPLGGKGLSAVECRIMGIHTYTAWV